MLERMWQFATGDSNDLIRNRTRQSGGGRQRECERTDADKRLAEKTERSSNLAILENLPVIGSHTTFCVRRARSGAAPPPAPPRKMGRQFSVGNRKLADPLVACRKPDAVGFDEPSERPPRWTCNGFASAAAKWAKTRGGRSDGGSFRGKRVLCPHSKWG
jgi:hypothetical protein